MTQSRILGALILQLWAVNLQIFLVQKVIYIIVLLRTMKKEMQKPVLATLRQFRK